MSVQPPLRWPEGKQFAFTVFDDPDSQTLEDSRVVYGLLRELGLRTTKGVWPAGPYRVGTSRSESCSHPEYLDHVIELQNLGFEIGFHGAALHSSERETTEAALDRFKEYFGSYPSAMANHFDNAEAIYWGPARLTGIPRQLYKIAMGAKRANQFFGEVDDHKYFWGDLCQARIRYCRNFVFREMNTLRMCPEMPYYDPLRPLVKNWYASSEGGDAGKFLNTIREASQDRLEEEGGACIMYTHFGKGFVTNGEINPRFSELISRISRKNGWFVPVSTLLDYIQSQRGAHVLSAWERARLEWTWLAQKITGGTS